MGSLTPGVTYIYEKVDGVTYAREFGKKERRAIGWDFNYKSEVNADADVWKDIFEKAKSNPALRHALDQCKIIYYLSEDHGT